MPSHAHEAIVQLFSDSPQLVDELLRRSLGIQLRPYAVVERLDANLSEAPPAEYRADGTIAFKDAAGACSAAFVVEVQLRTDPDKMFKWPFYVAQVRDRLRCDADLLVLTLDEPTARWARQKIRLGHANAFLPLVIGPLDLPPMKTAAEVMGQPELAALSFIAHAPQTDAATAVAIADGLVASRLEDERSAYYIDVARDLLPEVARRALEEWMIPADYVPRSEISKALIGLKQARAEAEAIGEAKGEARGEARGEVAGLRSGLTIVLGSLGFVLSTEQRATVEACENPEQLRTWIDRAHHVDSVDALLKVSS